MFRGKREGGFVWKVTNSRSLPLTNTRLNGLKVLRIHHIQQHISNSYTNAQRSMLMMTTSHTYTRFADTHTHAHSFAPGQWTLQHIINLRHTFPCTLWTRMEYTCNLLHQEAVVPQVLSIIVWTKTKSGRRCWRRADWYFGHVLACVYLGAGSRTRWIILTAEWVFLCIYYIYKINIHIFTRIYI